MNPDHILTLMQMYCYSGNYEKTRSIGEKFLVDYPGHSDPVRYIGRSYMLEGRPEEAIPYFRMAVEISQGKGYSLKDLIGGLIKVGEMEEAQGLIDQLQKTNQSNLIGPTGWCYIYSIKGDFDKAFLFLEKAIEEKDFWAFTIKYSQDWDEMRKDPRFDKVIDRMKFPDQVMD